MRQKTCRHFRIDRVTAAFCQIKQAFSASRTSRPFSLANILSKHGAGHVRDRELQITRPAVVEHFAEKFEDALLWLHNRTGKIGVRCSGGTVFGSTLVPILTV